MINYLITKRRAALSLGLAVCLWGARSSAAILDWDISGTGVVTGGTGNWNTASTFFTADGGVSNVAWINSNNDIARFKSPAGTVSLTTGITVGGLDFDLGGYTISGNTLTLGTSGTFNVDAGTTTINSILAGAASSTLTVTGAGTLTLTGSNTFTGNINVQSGKLIVTHADGLGTGTKTISVSSGATLDLRSTLNSTKNISLAGTGASGAGALVNNGTSTITPLFATVTLTANASIGGTGNINIPNITDGAGSFGLTKVGSNTVVIGGTANSYEGPTIINSGTLIFTSAAALPAATHITVAANSGVGIAFNFDQAFLSSRVTNNGGVILLGANNFNDLNFSASGLNYPLTASLGGGQGITSYYGIYTPPGSATAPYVLSGNGYLNFPNLNALTGSRDLLVTQQSIGPGRISLSNDNNYTGTTTIDGMELAVSNLSNGGQASSVGTSSSDIVILNDGTLRYSGPEPDSTDRALALGPNGGRVLINNDFIILTVGAIKGSQNFTKEGLGELIVSGTAAFNNLTIDEGKLTLNGPSSVQGTITITDGSLSIANSMLVAGATTLNGTQTLSIAAGQTLTLTDAFLIGANVNANITMTGGGALLMNNPTKQFTLANNTDDGSDVTATLDASALSSFTLNASNVRLGQGASNLTGYPRATLTLPTGASSTSTITTPAAGSIIVGGDSESTGTATGSTINLGGGSNSFTTGALLLGGGKNGGQMRFAAGSAGSFTLVHPTSGSKVNMIVGRSPVSTGTATTSLANLTTTGAVNMTLGDLTLGASNRDTANTTTGTFTLNAGSGLVTADAVKIGEISGGTNVSNVMTFNSTFSLGGGTTFQFNPGGSGFVTAATAGATHNRTLTINVSGGTLNMNGAPINFVSTGTGTTTLNLTGGLLDMQGGTIGNLTNLTFTGGTLRDLGTLSRALSQSNATNSVLDVLNNNATITGLYTLNGGTAQIAAGRTLNVPTGMTLNGGTLTGGGAGAATIVGMVTATSGTINPGSSPGTLAITGNLTLSAAMNLNFELGPDGIIGGGVNDLIAVSNNLTLDGTMNVSPLSGFGPGTYTLFTYGGALQNNTLNYILPVGYLGNLDLTTPGQVNLNITAVPEPSTLVLGGLGMLGLLGWRQRRKRVVDQCLL